MVSEPPQSLGLTGDAQSGGWIKALGLDDREGYIAANDRIVGLVDMLTATFSEGVFYLISTVGERCGLGGT